MKIQTVKNNILFASIACALALAATTSRAEQGGSAHYMPGSIASFIDAFPGDPGAVAVMNYGTYYNGDANGSKRLPLGGYLTADINATIYADSIAAIYQTRLEILGGGLAFGFSVPYVWMDVDGRAQVIGPGGVLAPEAAVSDSANGIGDIMLIPIMLGWTNIMPDFKLDARLSVYVPTGEYEVGQLANIGKNYWTFEPGIMMSWLSSKIGTEVSLYTGIDFNTKNEDVDYRSGSSLHFDMTVAQHFPLCGGFAGIGANGFYYKQLSGDSGSDALLGGFKSQTMGVGPVISYVRPIGKNQLLAELKWLPELDVENRMQGDFVWFKLGVMF